ncbi:MAG TPA: type II toxin-antitoxin system VapC family toxin [Terriglobales bacterium]|nr:type II toxin-antitoxin system VapC family toxin [Terriglobales bacterium]
MIVLDASAAVDFLLQTPAGRRIEMRIYTHTESLQAPHLLDLEVAQVLRRLAGEGVISASRSDEAIRDLLALRITRYPHFVFLSRIWQLRHNLSAYDAAYVALAEKLDAPLITRDRRLASAAGHQAAVEVF